MEQLRADLQTLKIIVTEISAKSIKNEVAIDALVRSIELLETYKERIVKLEGSMHYLTSTLDKTNTTLEKLDANVDSIKEVLTIQKGQQNGSKETKSVIWDVLKWVGVAGIIPMLEAFFKHYIK